MGKMQGLDQDEMLTIREGKSPDPKRNAAVVFALKVQDTKGFVSDDDLAKVRDAGWDDAAIADIVAVTALNLYTNFFNHVNDTELDFPEPPALH
jgi:alkylhydroperoxidase family enzyme